MHEGHDVDFSKRSEVACDMIRTIAVAPIWCIGQSVREEEDPHEKARRAPFTGTIGLLRRRRIEMASVRGFYQCSSYRTGAQIEPPEAGNDDRARGRSA